MLSAQEDYQNNLGPVAVHNLNNRPMLIFPTTDISDAFQPPSTNSSYVKTSDMSLGGGIVHFHTAAVKKEPVDFSISSLTSFTSSSHSEKQLPAQQQPSRNLPDALPIKIEPPSSPLYDENSSEIRLISNPSESLNESSENVHYASHSNASTSDQNMEDVGLQMEPLQPAPSSELLSKVPVMRICRQNSNSFYTASSNVNKETGPLKALQTSDNVEQQNSNPNVAPICEDVATQNCDLENRNTSNDVTGNPIPRKARLKFSPRIRNSQNAEVPFQTFHTESNGESLALGLNKENQNVEEKSLEKSIFYQWDMSAFPKCVVQLKKLKMENMFLDRKCKEHSSNEDLGGQDGLVNDLTKIHGSLQCSNSDDGKKKKRSVEPREKARCGFCGMLTLSADVWRHLLAVYKVKDDLKNEVIENQETLTCQVCGAGLCSEIALSMHMHHLHIKKDNPPIHKCIICEETFPTQTYLAFHLQTHYFNQKNVKKPTSKTEQGPSLITSPDSTSLLPQYECLTCHRKFQRYQALNAHKKLHREQPVLKCNVCGKTFAKSYKLKCHLVVHTDERPFKCTECGKSFRFKSSLRSHKFFHMGVNPYKCKYCDQGFLEGGNLLKHIRRTHQGHQSEICNICGKVLTDKQALKYHMRLHNSLIHQRRKITGGRLSSSQNETKNTDASSNFLVNSATADSNPIVDDVTGAKELTNQTTYENSVLFHLLTSPQRDKQQNDTQQNVDLYEWSESTTDTTSEHDSGMNSPPQTQRECLLCDMSFHTMQKMKKHLLSYHRISPRKIQRLMP